jgi:AraC-like DNA-binding protein
LVLEKPVSIRPGVTLLNSAALDAFCTRSHVRPPADLAAFIEVGWAMRWRLPAGHVYKQRVLPNPCVQIVVNRTGAEIFGVVTGAFSTTFEGDGFVFGLKFRTGGFYPFFGGRAVSSLMNQRVPIEDLFESGDPGRLRALAATEDSQGLMDALAEVLRRALSPSGRTDAVERIAGDREILRVEQAAAALGVSERALQRLFREQVGVSPKWVIRRFRLQEAAAIVESGVEQNWADLANRLGYFDQSHLIREFTEIVGEPPAAYAKFVEQSKQTT